MKSPYLIARSFKRSVWNLFDFKTEVQNFGFSFTCKDIILRIVLNWTRSYNAYERLHNNIFKYLINRYPQFVDRLKSEHLSYIDDKVKTIWVLWWQGLEQAPQIVKECQKQLQKYSGEFDIVFLTKDNYKDYCEIPDYIIEKTDKGQISLTNLSDVIRIDLLARRGGLWIDSTVLLTHQLDEKILVFPFYSIKTEMESNHSVSKYQFCTFFMYSKMNNSYFLFIRDFLFKYWEEHNFSIHYLLIDYIMILATRYNDDYKNMLEKIPYSNLMLHQLRENFNSKYTPELWNKLMSHTSVYKLTYKAKTLDKILLSEKTIWAHLKEYIAL